MHDVGERNAGFYINLQSCVGTDGLIKALMNLAAVLVDYVLIVELVNKRAIIYVVVALPVKTDAVGPGEIDDWGRAVSPRIFPGFPLRAVGQTFVTRRQHERQ